MTEFTGNQYALSVEIGKAVCRAYGEGVTHRQAAEVLQRATSLAASYEEMGLPEASLAISAAAE